MESFHLHQPLKLWSYNNGGQIFMEEKMVKTEKWVKHYSSSQTILLVGEGDFSFSMSLAIGFGSANNIYATSLNSYGQFLSSFSLNIALLFNNSWKFWYKKVEIDWMIRIMFVCFYLCYLVYDSVDCVHKRAYFFIFIIIFLCKRTYFFEKEILIFLYFYIFHKKVLIFLPIVSILERGDWLKYNSKVLKFCL